MKLKSFFSKWSRTIHRWIGLYFAVIVLLYLAEFFILPIAYSDGLPTVDGAPPIHKTVEGASLSFDQALQMFGNQTPQGVRLVDDIDAISYLPHAGLYQFEDRDRYFEWYLDAQTGELLKYGFKADLFLEDKGILGWLNPTIHTIIEFPMLLLLVSLAISGIYLFAMPFLARRGEINSETNALPGSDPSTHQEVAPCD
jgi:hypothetical protein